MKRVKKLAKITLIITLVSLLVVVLIYFGKKNRKSAMEFGVKKPFVTDIVKKTVATGKIVPEDEVLIKPQISGIIEKIYVKEGGFVNNGDLIAKIRIVPNEQSLNSAEGRKKNAEIRFHNTAKEYRRNKVLFEKGVISDQSFSNYQLQYNEAQQNLENAKSDYQIIKLGSANRSISTNTKIRATVSGTILEIPVKEGNQVIESNNFNAGTTIANIANLKNMIFEGHVDESEVGKLKEGTVLEVTIGAVEGVTYKALLNFIAPKGLEEQGAVLFKIKASLILDKTSFIRAGYSANAELILDKKTQVLSIKESLVQYDRKTEQAYVEVEKEDQVFERVNIVLGISDGINVEVISGVSESDHIKVWNKASKEEDEEKENTRNKKNRQ